MINYGYSTFSRSRRFGNLIRRGHTINGAQLEMSNIAEGYYADPNWSMLPGVRHQFERDRERFQGGAWPRGFAANRSNIDRLMRYAVDQGIGAEYLPPKALFASGTLGT